MNIKKVIGFISMASVLSFQAPLLVQAKDNSTAAEQTKFEPQFLEKMSMHHQEGIEMAKMAQEKAESKSVKDLSQKIIKKQTQEIAELKSWEKKWYPGEKPVVDMEKMDMTKLHSLSGKEFDVAFLNMMSKHHEGAVEMSKDAESKLEHKEVKKFAQKTIKDQTAEISKIEKMKSSIQ